MYDPLIFMNFIEDLVQELREENLLDEIDYAPFDQERNNSISQLNQNEKIDFVTYLISN